MAQTRKRRQSKHRGNAAGMVEARGRTGRKPTEGEKAASANGRQDRFSKPPTWQGAFQRALLAAAIFGVLTVLFFKFSIVQALPLVAVMTLLYVPLGYYTDLWIYNRRQKKLQGG